jgi:hypothetical protein
MLQGEFRLEIILSFLVALPSLLSQSIRYRPRGPRPPTTFQVMRRTFATLSKAVGVDAHTRSAQMGNTVDVNVEYAMASFEHTLCRSRRTPPLRPSA